MKKGLGKIITGIILGSAVMLLPNCVSKADEYGHLMESLPLNYNLYLETYDTNGDEVADEAIIKTDSAVYIKSKELFQYDFIISNEVSEILPASITKLTVAEGVEAIESEAFYANSSLRTIYLPNSVEKVGERCVSSETIVVSDNGYVNKKLKNNVASVRGKVARRVNYSFDCDSRCITFSGKGKISKEFNFPKRFIEEVKFKDYKSEDIPDLSGSLIKEISIPKSVSEIRERSFAGCKNLEEIVIPGNVDEIGASAFEGCTSLEKAVLSNGQNFIDEATFKNCESLAEVYIPYGIETIDDEAFYGCRELEELNIPYGMQSIGERSFANCKELSKVIIPSTVNDIEKSAFEKDKNVVIEAPSKSYALKWASKHKIKYKAVKSLVKIGNAEYSFVEGGEKPKAVLVEFLGKKTKAVIPSFVKINGSKCKVIAIASDAFRGNRKIRSVQLPDTIEEISEDAFAYCTKLKNVTGGKNLERIGNRAFLGCKSLVRIPEWKKVDIIGKYAFGWCTNIGRVYISDRVEVLDIGTFRDSGIVRVDIPKSVTKIGIDAFRNCKSLNEINVYTTRLNTQKVGSKAFGNISSKAVISVPAGYKDKYTKVFRKAGAKKAIIK